MANGSSRLVGPDDQPVRIFAVLAMMVQDGAAHKSVWGCKVGDSALKFCMHCGNVVPSDN